MRYLFGAKKIGPGKFQAFRVPVGRSGEPELIGEPRSKLYLARADAELAAYRHEKEQDSRKA